MMQMKIYNTVKRLYNIFTLHMIDWHSNKQRSWVLIPSHPIFDVISLGYILMKIESFANVDVNSYSALLK